MPADTEQGTSTASHDLVPPLRTILTVRHFSERHPAFSQGSLRNLIFLSEGHGNLSANGLGIALVRIGRRVLIDEQKFFEWVESQQGTCASKEVAQ
jgi:hypothetical protein